MILNFPNILSLSRVFIAPLFLYFMLSENKILISSASFLFLIGAITDYFDGYLARKFNQTSDWGRFFDPLADKVLTLSAFLAFTLLNIIPIWIFIIIALRDVSTTILRIWGDRSKIKIQTSKSAKWKTFLQMSMIFYVLVLLFLINCECIEYNLKMFIKILNSDITFYAFVLLALYSVYTLIEYVVIIFLQKSQN